jgi:DNA-binding beta-propeller fold protein YncE
MGLAVDHDGNVWVTDGRGGEGKGHVVVKFSPEGEVLLTLGQPGVAGEGPYTLNQPSDVAVAPNGDIFVADGHSRMETNMRIVKYAPDGTLIKEWGRKGSAPGELNGAHGLAFDSRGRLFVADRENNRVQIFDQDGNFVDAWAQFGTPSGLYITSDDRLYVADNGAGIRVGKATDGRLTAFIAAEDLGQRIGEDGRERDRRRERRRLRGGERGNETDEVRVVALETPVGPAQLRRSHRSLPEDHRLAIGCLRWARSASTRSRSNSICSKSSSGM